MDNAFLLITWTYILSRMVGFVYDRDGKFRNVTILS